MAAQTLDQAEVEAFAGRLMELYVGGMLTYLVDIGHRTGLFAALAEGPATSAELAARADLQERYVREWLAALATGGIVDYQPGSGSFRLPPERAACLTGRGSANLAPLSRLDTHLAKHVDAVARAFREGGGVPYAEFRPEFTDVMDALGRGVYDELLVDAYLPLVPGLAERLAAGARVADVGCGTGHAMVLLARAFPASTFVGYDLAADAIARARSEAAGLANVGFEVRDVARLEVERPYDVVFVFDAIHDQVDPAAVLARIHAALAPGGTFVMVEPRASSDLEDNLGNPLMAFLYGISTLHCMTVSLAGGGAGLGTAWGEQAARAMLAEAGFGEVAVHEAPGDPTNAVFVTARPPWPRPARRPGA
ncbi:MAG TPA: class I SAM-dependent methyltransferase [Actinomycetota bacterium]|jgi:SAM-dependent methyltransferase|nr:class I SAM-dependent methyltransferase [Actinomycetota bacterium]